MSFSSDLSGRLLALKGVIGFDIETCPRLAIDALPPRERQKIEGRARSEAGRDGGDEVAVHSLIHKELTLHPLLTRIVSIAFHALADGSELALVTAGDAQLREPAYTVDERDGLAAFWQVAERAEILVGYHSRRFDVPVLNSRSLLLSVTPSVDLLNARPRDGHRGPRHVDLHESVRARLTGDRAVSLELVCFALGIAVKTTGHGSEVQTLVEQGRYDELARYNLEDARATARLYQRLTALGRILPELA